MRPPTPLTPARARALSWLALGTTLLIMLAPTLRAQGLPPPLPASIVHQIKLGPDPKPNGVFRVQVWREGHWVAAGDSAHSQFPAEGTVRLEGLPPGEPVRIRIRTQGPGAAHLDAVLLDGQPPSAAQGAPLRKLVKADQDIANAEHRTIELTFPPPAHDAAALTLLGRIEPKVLSKEPAKFPARNTWRPMTPQSEFYTYRLGSSPGRLTVDGRLGGERLGQPFFAEMVPSGSGHPNSTTYGWVRDDGKTLYVAIDLTPDNTADGNEDYTQVLALVAGRVKEFKVTEAERRWGRSGFTYTDKVAWQHRTYEFAIPLAELDAAGAPAGTPLRLAFAAYGTYSAGSLIYPALAYDSTHNRYLMAYTQVTTVGFYYWANAQLIQANGQAIGNPIPLVTVPGAYSGNTAVAYDAAADRYCVVWYDNRLGSYNIYFQLLNGDGSLSGGNVQVSNSPGVNLLNPRIANDPVRGRFLITWDNSTASDVAAALIANDGTILRSEFPVTTAAGGQSLNAVAYDPQSNQYLVAWQDTRTGDNDVYGQLVSADGLLTIPTDPTINFPIATQVGVTEGAPALAALPGRFLVAYTTYAGGPYGVSGNLVLPDGTLQGGPIAISTNTSVKAYAAVASDPVRNRYRVIWEDQRNFPAEVLGQELDASGILVGTSTDPAVNEIVITAPPNSVNQNSVAANTYCGNWLSAGQASTLINTLVTAVSGACSPTSSRLTFGPGSANGVVAKGSVGAPTTFEVMWSGPNLPTQAELWVDFNQDGNIGGTWTRAWPGDGAGAAPWLALAALLPLLVVVAGRRSRRWRPALTATCLALALALAAGGLTACGSSKKSKDKPAESSTGGGSSTSSTSSTSSGGGTPTASERIPMIELVHGDTNTADGKYYYANVTFSAPGTYAYKFVFSDGTTAAVGQPALGGTLNVN